VADAGATRGSGGPLLGLTVGLGLGSDGFNRLWTLLDRVGLTLWRVRRWVRQSGSDDAVERVTEGRWAATVV
jgi:hypothetical protein